MARRFSGTGFMKVLLCHNFYQRPGGEDNVFADETALLQANGHEVIQFTRHNGEIESMSKLEASSPAAGIPVRC